MADLTPPDRSARQFRLFSEALDSGRLGPVKRMINALTPQEIARLLESLPPKRRAAAWGLVDPSSDGDVLVHVAEEVRESLIAEMDDSELIAAASDMDLDDLADIIEDLPDSVISAVLAAMDREHRDRLESVLSYDDDTAGGLMNTDVITVRSDVSVEVVLRYLRMRGEIPPLTDHLFLVARDGTYQGRVALSELLVRQPEAIVADLIDASVPPFLVHTEASQVATEFETHDWVSAPVVDQQNRLVGRITIDDVVDVIRAEAEHRVMSMAGLDEEQDMFAPIIPSALRRAVWLGINLLTAFLAAAVIGQFEATLEQIVALAVLMPVVASMGGIAGTQTLTLIVRGLALGTVNTSNAGALLRKELAVGALNGLLWAAVVAAVAGLWFGSLGLSLVIAAALIINLLAAALSGVVIPLTLKRFSIDPALAGGVVLTTVTDVIGFFAFLGLGTLVLI